ncbi:MAG: type I-U CRISPR-associated protein Csx17 [Bradymonadaceae bacterium]|nr:type I-U CRISPR-associated protein Csx17 [Lujinxingiaceae bacterium]
MNPTQTLALAGCHPTPLAHYLKALAILRLVAEQADSNARAMWKDGQFHLVSRLDRDELVAFFLHQYCPTPIISPWNGRAGFLEGENKDDSQRKGAIILRKMLETTGKRFGAYRDVLAHVKELPAIQELNLTRAEAKELDTQKKRKKPYDAERLKTLKIIEKAQKNDLLTRLRAQLDDAYLTWLDACWVLSEKASPVPLLGAGGCEGSMDFSVNLLFILMDLIHGDSDQPTPNSESLLTNALFETTIDGFSDVKTGPFYPAVAGGKNSAAGFGSKAIANPWDFVLMLEGAVFFAAASVRRLEGSSDGTPSAPFTAHTSSAGYGSSSMADGKQSRGEVWLPLWPEPASYRELRSLFSEGRVTINKRAAKNGVDFARAVTTLGVDRGIEAFERIGIQERNGLSFFAIPLGRIQVNRQPQVDLLEAIDPWLDRFMRSASGKNSPARVASAARQLEQAIFALTRQQSTRAFQDVLIALGRAEQALAASYKWTKDNSDLRPLQLKNERWVTEADDQTREFRLAAALAGLYGTKIGLREHVEPAVREGKNWNWGNNSDPNVVWSHSRLVESMINVLKRRLISSSRTSASYWPDKSSSPARLDDIAAFIEGRVDEQRINDLIGALVIVDTIPHLAASEPSWQPDAIYSLMKLCFAGHTVRDVDVPINNAIVYRALAGSSHAVEVAARRLRASGLPPAVGAVHASAPLLNRAAAALLFPISKASVLKLANAHLRPGKVLSP